MGGIRVCTKKISNSTEIENRTRLVDPGEESSQILTKSRIHGSVYQKVLHAMDDIYRLSGKVKFTHGVGNVAGKRKATGPYAEASFVDLSKHNVSARIALLGRLKSKQLARKLAKRMGKHAYCAGDVLGGLTQTVEQSIPKSNKSGKPKKEAGILGTILKSFLEAPITTIVTIAFSLLALYGGGLLTGLGFHHASQGESLAGVFRNHFNKIKDRIKNLSKKDPPDDPPANGGKADQIKPTDAKSQAPEGTEPMERRALSSVARFLNGAQAYLARPGVQKDVRSVTVASAPEGIRVPAGYAVVRMNRSLYFMPIKGVAMPRVGLSVNVRVSTLRAIPLRVR